jgi:hypothetical protein
MVTLEITRKAERKGDTVVVHSTSVDEHTTGEFRETYIEKSAQVGALKDQNRELEKQLASANAALKGQDMNLLRKLKKKAEKLIMVEQIESMLKQNKEMIELKEKELAGIKPLFEQISKEELERHEAEMKEKK